MPVVIAAIALLSDGLAERRRRARLGASAAQRERVAAHDHRDRRVSAAACAQGRRGHAGAAAHHGDRGIADHTRRGAGGEPTPAEECDKQVTFTPLNDPEDQRGGGGERDEAADECAEEPAAKKKKKRHRRKSTELRNSDGSPAHYQPRLRGCASGSVVVVWGAEFHHQEVPGAAVSVADLSGGGDRVRDSLGGVGGDQRDRDRLWPQPERVLGRGGGVDAVHPVDLADVWHRRQRGRPQGPVQPGRRDLRRGPVSVGGRLRGRCAPGDLCLQPRRLVRRLGAAPRTADRRCARRSGRLLDRAHRRPLPRLRPRPLRRRPGRGHGPGTGHRDLRRGGLSGGRSERRCDPQDRPERPARELRRARGRVRQPLHLLAPRLGLGLLPRAEERRPAGGHAGQGAPWRSRAHGSGLGGQPARS